MDMCQELLFQPLPPHGWWVCVRMHRSLPMVSIYMYSPHTPRWYRIMMCCHYSCSHTSVGSICLNKTSIILDDKRKRYVKARYTDRLQKTATKSSQINSTLAFGHPNHGVRGFPGSPLRGSTPPQGTLSGILAIFGVATLCFWKLQLAAEAKVQKANVPGREKYGWNDPEGANEVVWAL